MAKKAENKVPTPEHESEEWVRVDSNGNPLADQAPSAEELEAQLAGANRAHTETLGDAWAVLTGQNPAAIMAKVLPNHHITKPVLIGEIQADGQFQVVWETPSVVPGEAWSHYLPESKDLIGDWTDPINCGNYNTKTKKCGGASK